MKVKRWQIWAGNRDRKTDRTEQRDCGWDEKKRKWAMERENDAGCYFSHYQLPHDPANAGFQGIERQQKKELPVAVITEAKWYDICVWGCVCVCVCAHSHTFYGCFMRSTAALTTLWHLSLRPLVCESHVYRCKLNFTSCTIFLLLFHTFLSNYPSAHRRCFLKLNCFI